MTFALISATRFQFSYETSEQLPLRTLNDDLKRTIYPTMKDYNVNSNNQDDQQTHVNDQQQQPQQLIYATSNTLKFMQLIQVFMTLKNATFLFIAW
jgi:hypothetical protein